MYICTGKNEKTKAIYLAAISQEKQQIGICVSKQVQFPLCVAQFFVVSTCLHNTSKSESFIDQLIKDIFYKSYSRAWKI